MTAKKHPLRFLLLPLALLYRFIVGFRNRLFDYGMLKSYEFDIPVISVGNITVGGTGKTPHTEYLVRLLKDDYKIAVLSRGYKRRSRGFQDVELNSTSRDVGDEPKQIKHKFPEVQVSVKANRVQGINRLKNDIEGLDAIILDDAYQHRHVKAGVSILLIDYYRPMREDYMLPFGELREPPVEMRRANIIIVTNTPHELKPIEKRIMEKRIDPWPYQDLFFSYVYYGNLTPVFSDTNRPATITENDLEARNFQVLLVTGIAKSLRVKDHLHQYTDKIWHLEFGDHHTYRKKDVNRMLKQFKAIEANDKMILTTEKDAVKFTEIENLPDELRDNLYFFPLEVEFRHNEENEFKESIIKYVKTNKRHNSLFKK